MADVFVFRILELVLDMSLEVVIGLRIRMTWTLDTYPQGYGIVPMGYERYLQTWLVLDA